MTSVPDFTKIGLDGGAATARAGSGAAAGVVWEAPEGIAVRSAYTAADTAGLDFLDTFPGIAPFVRGPYPTMYARSRGPSASTPASPPPRSPTPSTARNLAAGQKGLSVAFDLATHRGYDSDHPRVRGDVGKAGVAIDSVDDMKILFDGIPLEQDERVDDHERRGAAGAGAATSSPARSRACRRRSSPAPSRTTSSKSSWCATPTSIRPSPRMRIVADIIELHGAAHAEVQLDLDLRLSHAGGRRDGGPGARPSRSPTASSTCAPASASGPRHRRVRAAAVVLLGDRHELLHGGRQDARRAPAVGEADQERVRAEGRQAR